MIYLTGDTHGGMERFQSKEAKQLKKGDTLIICGDFGFIWDGSKGEEKHLKWLGKRRYTIAFVEGTHDNLDRLAAYPEEEWNGGKIHRISGNLIHLMRGECYRVEGKTIFAFGGGESPDIELRREGERWWPQEMPTQEEIAHGEESLAQLGNRVDLIVTHECSGRLYRFLNPQGERSNLLGAFFDRVSESCEYRLWAFGSCHLDKRIPPKTRALFQEIVPFEG